MEYSKCRLSFEEFVSHEFVPGRALDYEIEYKNVAFSFLINVKENSSKAIILGTGDIDRQRKKIPVYDRHSWKDEFPCTSIYYSDPTLKLNDEVGLCWCYGKNDHWYLESIAYIITVFCKKNYIRCEDLLFFGSSGGGFTSILLAGILHARATVINPQLIVTNFWPRIVERMKKTCLDTNESLIAERTSVCELFKREHYIPELHVLQNMKAEHDITTQIVPFLLEMTKGDAEQIKNKLNISFYCQEGGHRGMPSKEECINIILADLEMGISDNENQCMSDKLVREKQNEIEEMNWNMFFSSPKIQVASNDSVVEIAEMIMQGELYILPKLETMKYDIQSLDFNVQFSSFPRTFQLYLQALNPIKFLVKAFEITGKEEFLQYAFLFLGKWYAYASQEENRRKNKFIYVDHSVALRAEVLIYLARVSLSKGFLFNTNLIREVLLDCGFWLAKEENYTVNHNHGIMEDDSLLQLGYLLRNDEWIKLAKQRLKEQEKVAFSEDFVHTENSPVYANMVKNLFTKIGRFLVENRDSDGADYLADMKRAEAFINWMMKPNGIIAQVGDSDNIAGQKYGDERSMERKNSSLNKLYKTEGYYFYRSRQDNIPYMDTWKMVKSGCVKLTHKHEDDLSFMLYSKGYEIFADCGAYGKGYEFKKFFKTAKAHNTVVVDDSSYEIYNAEKQEYSEVLFKRLGIVDANLGKDYDHVRLINDCYEGVCITRDFCSMGDLTIIYDNILSEEKHEYYQLFHLAEDITIVSASAGETILQIAETDYKVKVMQFEINTNLDVEKGDLNRASYGLITRQMNHMDVIHTLKYSQKDSNALFITLIAIIDKEDNVYIENGRYITLSDIQYENKEFYIPKYDIKIADTNLMNFNPEVFRKYEIKKKKSFENAITSTEYILKKKRLSFTINIADEFSTEYEYAYYLYKNEEVVEKSTYMKQNTYTFTTTVDELKDKYFVKYFLREKRNKKSKKSFISDKII